ncbi:MAG: hypothetical protein ABJA16_00305 [Nakamurella sp.]
MSQTPHGPAVTRKPARASRWWIAGVTFVVGLLAGVVVAGLLIRSSPSVGADPASTAPSETSTATTSGADGTSPSSGAEVQIVVNDACLRAINGAQDAYNIINRIGSALTDFNLTALDGIIRDLQPLQASLRDDIAGCSASARLPDGSLTPTSLSGTSSAEPSGGTTAPETTTSTSAVATTTG